mmetsp:Transcript_52045/g.111314  ORF Transcript_52045/g.111314 Transcript_52045/m.111314 type:complete len:108 (-) Transcript_52045:185-508(-)|eukprot:CAMPEP_0183349462 /NCGR_PEP_ID=MMETSP0164_2-20130417/13636_1 /TAXON_ID=221442 /ORGANISM="Coccolithus pelagicus ssp braarudi, Strain PLY182g" /LENGTH=107 /DNA_ID=CAMNT_0025521179 /DNA_START=135 /DNA_END=458 /DNA_ORIENTATION=+
MKNGWWDQWCTPLSPHIVCLQLPSRQKVQTTDEAAASNRVRPATQGSDEETSAIEPQARCAEAAISKGDCSAHEREGNASYSRFGDGIVAEREHAYNTEEGPHAPVA